jgi:hypothetical protein
MALLLAAGAVMAAPAVNTATGGGTVDWPADRVTYGFNAQVDADGIVKGQMNVQHRDVGYTSIHGDVTCLYVDGADAWLGGVVTKSDNPGVLPGAEFIFQVQDGGKLAPDMVSSINYFATAADCATAGPMGLIEWTNGQVKVE